MLDVLDVPAMPGMELYAGAGEVMPMPVIDE